MTQPLFFQRRFLPMWTALCLGAFADNMLRQALIIGIAFGAVPMGGFGTPDDAIPIVGSLFAVAVLVFSSISGQVAERYETAMLFRRLKFIEVVLMALAAAGFLLNSGWLLVGVLFAMGAQSAFFSPARVGAMPKYLYTDELVRGNGFCNAGLYVSILVGLFVGGLLIAAPGGGIKVGGVLFAASLLGWLAVLFAPAAAADAPDLKLDWNPFRQSGRIFGYALGAPGVARPLMAVALFYYISTMVTVLAPLYARGPLGADEAVATAIMGLFAVGIGTGALAAAGLAKGRSGLGFSALGVCLAGVCSFLVYALTLALPPGEARRSFELFVETPQGIALGAVLVVSAIAMGLYVVPLQAAMQRRAPAEQRSRIMAAGNMANAMAAIAGSLSVLFVTRTALEPHQAFLVIGALQAAIAAYMLRRRARVPSGLYDEMLTGAAKPGPRPARPSSPSAVENQP
ncbi:MFS transporter [Amphiplicatus metriothermophilus]|uniref:Major Facilitator Superfamily protein n=1 Tax=Amphiplicatus metriothermophilus TaxID=1519374 RepID=A0A239PL57_9PROT|nr:MFS transporter [Amphiplicatus metriothermophilus]MBB5517862.1 MFS family permease [Amphiplicatus metriothermophilus]SNT67804.1 Major Facilitator Superfamily protein [Amphiplicatus metriothermophilus]